MKHGFHAALLAIICLGLTTLLFAEPAKSLEQDEIIDKIKLRSEQTIGKIAKLTYVADSLTTVTNAAGKVERTVTSRRRITFTPPDQIDADFQSMTINGRALSAEEIAEELKKSKGRRGKSPFLPGEMPKYRFAVTGEKQHEGLPVWNVSFEPLAPAEGLAVGNAYIHQETYDVVFMTFRPSQVPSVMKEMKAEMWYQPVNNRWLPSTFKMRMHVKVAFIFTLADQVIDSREIYSDHQIQDIVQ